jgi:hypothetical protein
MSIQKDYEALRNLLAKARLTIQNMIELAAALITAGFSASDIVKLTKFDLKGVKDLINGHATIQSVTHMIDGNLLPSSESKQTIEYHRQSGIWQFDAEKIDLYRSERQKGGSITGHVLQAELADKQVLNINVLNYLLDHQELIPDSWKGKYIFFWGTIFRNDGQLFVRCLYWNGMKWSWCAYWLGSPFIAAYYAAVEC